MTAEPLGPEQALHGPSWGRVHGGYFSDPAVAKPLVDAVRNAWIMPHPDVIVDLGGGTGFLLAQLKNELFASQTTFVVLDGSPAQLEVAGAAGISTVCGSVAGFQRGAVVPAGGKALWLMRSVLHYAGETGLTLLLRHIRAQARAGEHWIHQTACFERQEDADCLNALYRKMHTAKRYLSTAALQARLEASGWRVDSILPAPPLKLGSDELGFRYGLDAPALLRIGSEMAAEFGGHNKVFQSRPDGFQAELHYRIFCCRAAH